MEFVIDGVKFEYSKSLWKINISSDDECIDCIDLDYEMDRDEFERECRNWICDNR